ncbi:zinc-regulated transporter 2 [Hortaea werneckii]|nr:zinc-regulated transporter 2 [Hortaea werneckii]KAI7003722.1 zinc-regulated transporter 2 [Hortaea werneckii]KAI7662016.1 zinc-regulated transporter 2 [Hortaea werneckii]
MRNHVAQDSTSLSSLPLHLLRAEVARRQSEDDARPACGSGNKSRHYDTGLHVFALFLILLLSTLACSFPIIVKRFPKLPVPSYALFLSRHFGTGVLIATAFVHLLPTAYTSLTDPCLPSFWNEGYPAMSGFIAMCSVLAVVGIEMVFAIKGAGHNHSVDLEQLRGDRNLRPRVGRSESSNSFRHEPLGQYDEADVSVPLQEHNSPRAGSTDTAETLNKPLPPEPPFQDDDSDPDLDELDPMVADDDRQPLTSDSNDDQAEHSNGHLRNASSRRNRKVAFADPPTTHSNSSPTAQDTAHEQRAVLQCLMLEAGILFHSVFIGMALSVSTGAAFVVLLVAISFHQTFEGLALGSRIAGISSFPPSSPKPWLMSAMYGVTTPIGQAIGLAVHRLYDPESQFGLLMVGIVNAISSGLLLYAGLVQLLAEDFLTDRSYAELQGRRRLEACGAVVGGSMLMALVGAWA